MIINKPTMVTSKDFVIVKSIVEFTHRSFNSRQLSPIEIYFQFPLKHQKMVSDRADAFLAGMYYVAMRLGEDIEVYGKVSPKLVENLKQVERYCTSVAYIDETKIPLSILMDEKKLEEYYKCADNIEKNRYFHNINIMCHELSEDDSKGNAVMASFSGGIDAYYTHYKHLHEYTNTKHQITHSLFIDGFDTSVDDINSEVADFYEGFLKSYGITLIHCRTNIKEFSDKIVNHSWSFASFLTSTALALSQGISRFYIASSFRYDDILPLPGAQAVLDGSSPMIDILYCTEHLEVIHYDAISTRIEKTIALANWPEVHDKIRCCWWPKGKDNCCTCAKCIRTVITLKIGGCFDTFKGSFPNQLGWLDAHKLIIDSEKNMGFYTEIINFAKERKKWHIVIYLQVLLLKKYLIRFSPRNLFRVYSMAAINIIQSNIRFRKISLNKKNYDAVHARFFRLLRPLRPIKKMIYYMFGRKYITPKKKYGTGIYRKH